MDSLMAQLCPHLAFLGDVHTHPYSSLPEAQEAKGWCFSDEDLMAMSNTVWDLTEDRLPLWLVIAIAPLKRVRDSLPKELEDGSGAWQFDIGDMRFWVKAGVVSGIDEDGAAVLADITFINLIPRLYNFSGNRLGARPHG